MQWQIQEAKQRFSELVRRAEAEGPQFVTRHNHQVVVVMSARDFHQSRPGGDSRFKAFLQQGPDLSVLDLRRDRTPARRVELAGGEDGEP